MSHPVYLCDVTKFLKDDLSGGKEGGGRERVRVCVKNGSTNSFPKDDLVQSEVKVVHSNTRPLEVNLGAESVTMPTAPSLPTHDTYHRAMYNSHPVSDIDFILGCQKSMSHLRKVVGSVYQPFRGGGGVDRMEEWMRWRSGREWGRRG